MIQRAGVPIAAQAVAFIVAIGLGGACRGQVNPRRTDGQQPASSETASPTSQGASGEHGATGESKDEAEKPGTPGALQTWTGILRSGYVGIGGEHTGWMLLMNPDAKTGTEVDPSKAKASAKELVGKRVTITGRLIQRSRVERGRVMILVAEKIVLASP